MVSVLRGAVGNGGAMVRLRRIRTVVVCWFTEKKEIEGDEEGNGGGARKEAG
jgi:hypothetical protein